MASIDIKLSDNAVRRRLGELQGRVSDVEPALYEIGEALLNSTRAVLDHDRPEGDPWEPLSKTYESRKPKNADEILTPCTATCAAR